MKAGKTQAVFKIIHIGSGFAADSRKRARRAGESLSIATPIPAAKADRVFTFVMHKLYRIDIPGTIVIIIR